MNHSFVLPFVFILLIQGALMPLIVRVTNGEFYTFAFFFIMMLFLKRVNLEISRVNLYQGSKTNMLRIYEYAVRIVLISLALFMHPVVGCILSVLWFIAFRLVLIRIFKVDKIDWEKMITLEENRVHRIYQFIALFTDVPEIKSKVKRRKYLDGVINPLFQANRSSYQYLYARSFLRGTEYSGLVVRLTVIGLFVLFFVKEPVFSGGISLLFVYLIGFQLLPLYTQFDYVLFTKMFPVNTKQKGIALKQIIFRILLVVAILFTIMQLIVVSNKLMALFIFALLIIEVILFTQLYVGMRIKKMER
jgi:ABC-2 type transport system permease protein